MTTSTTGTLAPPHAPPAIPTPWTMPDKGKVGMLLLILAETSFFAIFVVAYLYYIGKSLNGPFPADVLDLPILGSICLLSSSVTIMVAIRALRDGAVGRFNLWWLVTILLGLETSDQRMERLALNEMYFGRQVPTNELAARLEAVTNDQIVATATRLFTPDACAVVLLGDVREGVLDGDVLGGMLG